MRHRCIIALAVASTAGLAAPAVGFAQTELDRYRKAQEAYQRTLTIETQRLEQAETARVRANAAADLDAKVARMNDAFRDLAKDVPGISKNALGTSDTDKLSAGKALLSHSKEIFEAYGNAIDAIADSAQNNAQAAEAQRQVSALKQSVDFYSQMAVKMTAIVKSLEQSSSKTGLVQATNDALHSAQLAKSRQEQRQAVERNNTAGPGRGNQGSGGNRPEGNPRGAGSIPGDSGRPSSNPKGGPTTGPKGEPKGPSPGERGDGPKIGPPA